MSRIWARSGIIIVLLVVTYLPVAGQDISDTTFYREANRRQIHFSPRTGWMNDPNGMVFYEGEYHLFYQYNPDSTVWGPMHWGHAVSPDLLHWQELPIALYPDSLGYIFSGSAVVDWNNSSGFGQDGKPPLVAIFTHHDLAGEEAGATDIESQSLAYSNDRGRTWTKYASNPVLPNPGIRDFRDPKVIYDDASSQWVMALAAHDRILFYGSTDLKEWSLLSSFGEAVGNHLGVWECPDLFPLAVDSTGAVKWILLVSINDGAPNGGSGTQYFVGEFDGTEFILDPSFRKRVTGGRGRWVDIGRDNYAGVTFSDLPQSDGRRVFLGWMSNWNYAQVVPATGWRSAMTLPRVLSLHHTQEGYALLSAPVGELDSLRGKARSFTTGDSSLAKIFTAPASAPEKGLTGEISMKLEFQPNDHCGVELYNDLGEVLRVGLIGNRNAYYCDRRMAGTNAFSPRFAGGVSYAPRATDKAVTEFQLLIDIGAVELFADGGSVVLTETFYPTVPFTGIRTFGFEDGSVKVIDAIGAPLKSIWR